MRRLRRFALGTLGLVAVLLLVAAIGSQTAIFRRWVRDQIVTGANDALAGELSVGRIDGTLLGSLELRDVRLTFEGARVLAVRRATARYALFDLLGGVLTINELTLDGVAVLLVEGEDGWNVARLVPGDEVVEEESGTALDIALEAVRLEHGSIKVVGPGTVYGLRDVTLDAKARFGSTEQEISIDRLAFAMTKRDVDLETLTGHVVIEGDGAIAARDVVLRTSDSELRATARIPGEAGGAYDVRLDVLRLAASELRALLGSDVPAEDVSGSLRAEGPPQAVALTGKIAGEAGGLGLDGTVDVTRADPAYDIALALDAFRPGVLLGIEAARAPLTGRISAKGEDGPVRYELALRSDAGTIESAGTFDPTTEHYDVRLAATNLDPAPWSGRPDLAGRLTATLTAVGTGFEPTTARSDLGLTVGPSRMGAVEVERIASVAKLANGRFDLEQFTVASTALRAQVQGAARVAANGGTLESGTATYEVHVRDLGQVAALAGSSAAARGRADLTGTAAVRAGGRGRPLLLDAKAHLAGAGLAFDDTTIGSLSADVVVEGLAAAEGRAVVDANANDVRAGGRPIERVDLDATWLPAAKGEARAAVQIGVRETEGRRHDLTATATLGPEAQRLELEVLRLDIAEDTWTLQNRAAIVWRNEQAVVEGVSLQAGRGGTLAIEGTAGLRGAQNLTLELTDVDLATLEVADGELGGRLAVEAHLAGSAAAPRLDATVTVAEPAFGSVTHESLALTIEARTDRLAVHGELVQARERTLIADVRLPLSMSFAPLKFELGQTLTGTLRANAIALDFLDPFVPQVSNLHGRLDADLELSGPVAEPTVVGSIAIEEGTVDIEALGVKYDPVELRARVDGRALAVETLRIGSGEGSLVGGGSGRLDAGVATVNAQFELKQFPLLDSDDGEVVLSGWLWTSGDPSALIIEGKLETDRLVLKIPETRGGAVRPPDPTITVVGNESDEEPPEVETTPPPPPVPVPVPGIYENSSIKVDVYVPNNAWVRRSDANIELRGWMTAWKKPQDELRLAGEIKTVRGWYTFQGRKFTVASGVVTFTGQDFDPLLNIVANYRAGGYVVSIKVGGRASTPSLELESDPALDQADILSVVLFGRPASELSSGQSAGLREQALDVASSYVAKEVSGAVAKKLGVDDLAFDPGEGLQGATVSVGKYVSDDIFVALSHKFGKQSVEQVTVEYTINPSWSLESSTDTLGDSGIDLFWKRRY